MYFCQKCGPFVKVYKEVWTEESDGPFKIEFIHHIEGNAVLADEVKIKPRPEGECIEYSYCGHCKCLIDREQKSDWGTSSSMLEKHLKKSNKTKPE